MLLLALIACGRCLSTDSVGRDACLQEHAVASATASEARERIARIEDPMARDVTILLWVDANRATGGREAEALCASLSLPSEQAACHRRFSAAHLNR